MPTLPLYTPNTVADASHRVIAPGGYEWWHFEAEDLATDTQLVATFHEGYVFHPGYLRAYARYRRRPTRVRPPVPGEYVCASFVLYRGGRVAHQFMAHYPATDFHAATEKLDVRIGPNRCHAGDDGTVRLTLRGRPWVKTGRGAKTLREQVLSAELEFVPRFSHPPAEHRFISRETSGADHYWVVADPLCDVTGTVRVDGAGEPLSLNFRGRGYHDHHYGTAPVGAAVDPWAWGRVLLPDRVYTFHVDRPRRRSAPDAARLLHADATGLREVEGEAIRIDWSRSRGVGLAYPSAISFGSRLSLRDPQLVDSSQFRMRIRYHAAAHGGSEAAAAFCEVAHPHRLQWPVVGRVVGRSIHRAEDGAGRR